MFGVACVWARARACVCNDQLTKWTFTFVDRELGSVNEIENRRRDDNLPLETHLFLPEQCGCPQTQTAIRHIDSSVCIYRVRCVCFPFGERNWPLAMAIRADILSIGGTYTRPIKWQFGSTVCQRACAPFIVRLMAISNENDYQLIFNVYCLWWKCVCVSGCIAVAVRTCI